MGGSAWTATDTRAGSPDGTDKLFDIEKLSFVAGGTATLVSTAGYGKETVFDPQGRKDFIWTFNADGSSTLADIDNRGTAPWTRTVQGYDAADRQDFSKSFSDDGTSTVVDYDQAGVNSWTSITQQFDAAGRLLHTTTFNDDGTTMVV